MSIQEQMILETFSLPFLYRFPPVPALTLTDFDELGEDSVPEAPSRKSPDNLVERSCQ
jgi:hypothetical protein